MMTSEIDDIFSRTTPKSSTVPRYGEDLSSTSITPSSSKNSKKRKRRDIDTEASVSVNKNSGKGTDERDPREKKKAKDKVVSKSKGTFKEEKQLQVTETVIDPSSNINVGTSSTARQSSGHTSDMKSLKAPRKCKKVDQEDDLEKFKDSRGTGPRTYFVSFFNTHSHLYNV